METPQEYYKHPGPMTELGAHAAQIRALPGDIQALCDVVQGLLIHRDWQGQYNVKLPDERVDLAWRARPSVESSRPAAGARSPRALPNYDSSKCCHETACCRTAPV